jgi:hypothetical protein
MAREPNSSVNIQDVVLHPWVYSQREVIAMIERAKKLGFDLGPQSPLNGLTIAEVDLLTREIKDGSRN